VVRECSAASMLSVTSSGKTSASLQSASAGGLSTLLFVPTKNAMFK